MYIAGVNRDVDTGDTYFDEIIKFKVSGSQDALNRVNRRNDLLRKEVSNTPPLMARAEYARWLVDCPNCHSAEFAFEDNLFFCTVCNNSDVQGKVKTVIMPDKRLEIEDTLGKRLIVNRHWYPYETLEKLKQENEKMGVI